MKLDLRRITILVLQHNAYNTNINPGLLLSRTKSCLLRFHFLACSNVNVYIATFNPFIHRQQWVKLFRELQIKVKSFSKFNWRQSPQIRILNCFLEIAQYSLYLGGNQRSLRRQEHVVTAHFYTLYQSSDDEVDRFAEIYQTYLVNVINERILH